MLKPRPSPRLAGRSAAHVFRILAIARERNLPLLPAVASAADVDGLPGKRQLEMVLSEASEETLVDLLGKALRNGVDEPGAGILVALQQVGLPAEGLRDLADWLGDRAENRQSFYRAVSYPFTVMITGSLVYLVAFHGFAMPLLMETFDSLFSELGASLPWLTEQFISFYAIPNRLLSSTTTGWMYTLVVLAVCIGCIRLGTRFPEYRFSLALPFVRPYLYFEAARNFSSSLSTLLAHNISLPVSVRQACRSVSNPILRDRLFMVAEQVERGEGLGECLRASRAFPPSTAWRLWSAYYRSTLEEELPELVRSCNEELKIWENRIRASASLIAGFIAAIILSPIVLTIIAMYLPMFTLISQI